MAYLAEKDFLIIKVEGTPGTAETLAAADFDVIFYEPKIKYNTEFDSMRAANGQHAELEDVAGMRPAEISAVCYARPAAAVDIKPKWYKVPESCGAISEVEGSTKGYSFSPKSAGDAVSFTIWRGTISRGATPVAILNKFSGCMGSMNITCEGIGKPIKISAKWTGKQEALADADNNALVALNVVTAADAATPWIFTNATATIGSTAIQISSFDLADGNKIDFEGAGTAVASGIKQYGIVSKAPRLTINPLRQAAATYDAIASMNANTTATVTITGTNGTIPWKITCPVCQIISADEAIREGLNADSLNFKLRQNGVSGSLIVATMDLESTWEFLQGAKA